MAFQLQYWSPVFGVKRNLKQDICTICKNLLERQCINCQTKIPYNADIKCICTYNKNCDHVYHKHCIETWFTVQKKCPLCMIDWDNTTLFKECNIHKNIVDDDTIKNNDNKPKKSNKPKEVNL